jgi:hypothetical protein
MVSTTTQGAGRFRHLDGVLSEVQDELLAALVPAGRDDLVR